MAANPGVVLVHGAWHTAWHFQNITTELERNGYLVEAPTLPMVGFKAVEDCMTKSVVVVKQAINNVTNSGRNAVVICHSLGGIVGSDAVAEHEEDMKENAFSQQHGHVVHLLYISAIIIEKGVKWAKQSDEPHALNLKDGVLHHLEPIERFYNTMEPALAQRCAEKLLPLVAAVGTTPTRYCGWADYGIPVTYIACERDMALSIGGAQLRFIKRLESAGVKDFEVERIDCDHTPWLSNGQSEFLRIMWDVLGKASTKRPSAL